MCNIFECVGGGGGEGALPMYRGMESRIFTTGLTIIALHSNGSHIFGILGVRKY